METIRDKNGKVIRKSRNLRGIREYVSSTKSPIKLLAIDRIYGGGKLCILFEDGTNYETNFADYSILKHFVRRWKNAYGAPLLINTAPSGIVEFKNPALAPSDEL